jgi:hypothetical protein
MTTLFDAMLNVARRVKSVYTGKATGGTTSTLIDTLRRKEANDRFNTMTLFMLEPGSISVGDFNSGTTRVITDFVQSTSTITVTPVWSETISAGDRYAISEANREDLIMAIQFALSDIGKITKVDESLTVVTNQTEYDLPSGVENVVRVEVAASDSADYDYRTLFHWRVINGKIYFPDSIAIGSGNKIRIYYNDIHDALSNDIDTISDEIPMPLLGAVAAYNYAWQQFANQSNSNSKEDALLSRFMNDKAEAERKYRVKRIPRDPIHGR